MTKKRKIKEEIINIAKIKREKIKIEQTRKEEIEEDK